MRTFVRYIFIIYKAKPTIVGGTYAPDDKIVGLTYIKKCSSFLNRRGRFLFPPTSYLLLNLTAIQTSSTATNTATSIIHHPPAIIFQRSQPDNRRSTGYGTATLSRRSTNTVSCTARSRYTSRHRYSRTVSPFSRIYTLSVTRMLSRLHAAIYTLSTRTRSTGTYSTVLHPHKHKTTNNSNTDTAGTIHPAPLITYRNNNPPPTACAAQDPPTSRHPPASTD